MYRFFIFVNCLVISVVSRQTGAGEWAGMKQETVWNCRDDDEAEVDRRRGLCSVSPRLRIQLSSFYVWSETSAVHAVTRDALAWNLHPDTYFGCRLFVVFLSRSTISRTYNERRRHVHSTAALYSEVHEFKFRWGDRLFSLRFFVVFLSFPRQMLGYYLKLSHELFCRHFSPIHNSHVIVLFNAAYL